MDETERDAGPDVPFMDSFYNFFYMFAGPFLHGLFYMVVVFLYVPFTFRLPQPGYNYISRSHAKMGIDRKNSIIIYLEWN